MPNPKCFVIIPFAAEFDAVYQTVKAAVETAVYGQPIHCYSLKEVCHAGRISDDILASIRESSLCVSDVTGTNPNVMLETGFALALDRPTVLIGRDIENLPFDLKDHRVQPYQRETLDALVPRLQQAIRETIARYDLGGTSGQPDLTSAGGPTIAVTGSMEADSARVRRRCEVLLAPYLGRDALWLVGSAGVTDEAAAEYLVDRNERVVAVGYHRLDLSGGIHSLVQSGEIGFQDGSVEEVPLGIEGASVRDIVFCIRANLVVLLWNGSSAGTEKLMHFFQAQGKSVLLGFT